MESAYCGCTRGFRSRQTAQARLNPWGWSFSILLKRTASRRKRPRGAKKRRPSVEYATNKKRRSILPDEQGLILASGCNFFGVVPSRGRKNLPNTSNTHCRVIHFPVGIHRICFQALAASPSRRCAACGKNPRPGGNSPRRANSNCSRLNGTKAKIRRGVRAVNGNFYKRRKWRKDNGLRRLKLRSPQSTPGIKRIL